MGALLIALDMIMNQGEGMIVKRYGKKYGNGGMFFNAVICLFSTVFFIVTDKGGLCFTKELCIYGAVSCLLFAAGFYSMYLALQIGSYVATKMISSKFSSLITILYGILILKEPASIFRYIAIVLVLLSSIMMKYERTTDENRKDFSLKWLICVLVSAVSNGFISVLSRMQQLRFEHAYDNEFMILSFGGAFVALFILGLIKERENLKKVAKYGILYGMGAGFFNGSKNFLNLLIYLYVPISVSTPVRTALGFMLSFVISICIYKEKFTKLKLLSIAIGIVALIMFKL